VYQLQQAFASHSSGVRNSQLKVSGFGGAGGSGGAGGFGAEQGTGILASRGVHVHMFVAQHDVWFMLISQVVTALLQFLAQDATFEHHPCTAYLFRWTRERTRRTKHTQSKVGSPAQLTPSLSPRNAQRRYMRARLCVCACMHACSLGVYVCSCGFRRATARELPWPPRAVTTHTHAHAFA
jgi:hypothetical protein